MKKILVTGANGQLGSDIKELSADFPGFTFIFTDLDELDITNKKSVDDFFVANKPDYLINCAAYTAVDKAESEPEKANLINNIAAGFLAEACTANNTVCFHNSTDYVFNGTGCKPYTEDDLTNPVSVYGKTKAEGEKSVLKAAPGATIIRTSWLYSNYGHNFVKTMVKLGREKELLTVVADQVGSPTYSGDLAFTILKIIDNTCKKLLPYKPGIYNYSNEGVCSWYDFALAVHEFAKISCKVVPVDTSAYPTAAKRPEYSILNKHKIKTVYRIDVPYWRDSLRKCIQRMR